MQKLLTSFCPLIFYVSIGVAQTTFYNNGLVSVQSGAIVQINGNLELNGSNNGSYLGNYGDITVSNSVNQGDVFINNAGNSALLMGDGTIHLDGDWINAGNFIAQNSTVELTGANQLITGSQLSVFNNLTLIGYRC